MLTYADHFRTMVLVVDHMHQLGVMHRCALDTVCANRTTSIASGLAATLQGPHADMKASLLQGHQAGELPANGQERTGAAKAVRLWPVLLLEAGGPVEFHRGLLLLRCARGAPCPPACLCQSLMAMTPSACTAAGDVQQRRPVLSGSVLLYGVLKSCPCRVAGVVRPSAPWLCSQCLGCSEGGALTLRGAVGLHRC